MRVQSKKQIRILRRQLNKATRNFLRTGDDNFIRQWDALDDALYKEWFIDSKRG